jgi:hypothetical protein
MEILDSRNAAQKIEIDQLADTNQQVESELANKVRLYFLNYVDPELDKIALAALEIMYNGFNKKLNEMNKYLSKFKYLDVIKKKGAYYLKLRNYIKLSGITPTHCSDLIRLFGAWIEGEEMNEKPFNGIADAKKAQYRPGLGPGMKNKNAVWYEMRQRMGKEGKLIRGIIKGEKKLEGNKYVKGEKVEGEYKAPWGELRKYPKGKSPWEKGAVPKHLKFTKYLSSLAIDPEVKAGGISLKGVINTSAVGKLDRLFGLLPGADISGTTADTIYTIEQFGADPLMYLLPLGTLVFNYHHTWLEVALALSINRYVTRIDYYLGFYSTCIPPYPTTGLLAKHRTKLKEYMMEAEDKFQLILRAYDASSVEGPVWCIHFNKEEKNRLREKLKARTLLDMASRFSSYPTPGEALRILEGTKFNFDIRNKLQKQNLPVT